MWDLTKRFEPRLNKAAESREELQEWKEELLPKVVEATASTSIEKKLSALAEVCFLFSAEMTYTAVVKTRALAVVMRDRHGMSQEELDKCLSGNNSTRQICTPAKSKLQ